MDWLLTDKTPHVGTESCDCIFVHFIIHWNSNAPGTMSTEYFINLLHRMSHSLRLDISSSIIAIIRNGKMCV